MKNVFKLFLVLCIALTGTAVFAQDIQTKGSISGTVTDSNGGSLPNAKVTLSGPQGESTTQTNDQGGYRFDSLIPGSYTVTVEQQGFKKHVSQNVVVNVGVQATVSPKLEAGQISEIVTVTAGVEIDQASTAVGSNLSDQLFQNIPVQRTVSSLFYLAPGVNDSLGGGRDNPSISGGSALDNLYIADGVNITDSAFGGLGTFSRSYGALGTGINTSFVKEVQVKSGGYEPQYGQATGGIINIITQSGGNDFHGALYGYARPKAFEATRKQPDDFRTNLGGKLLHVENYDAGADFGGPIAKNKLFFFTSFNPTISRSIVRGAQGSGLLTLLGPAYARRFRTWNYAEKVDWNITTNHTLAFSLFGDPTQTNKAPFSSLNIQNATAMSVLDYGTRNAALRYNGSFSPTWTVSASLSQNKNHFGEAGFDNLNNISDSSRAQAHNIDGSVVGGSFTAVGRGFIEPTNGKTWRTELSTLKTVNLWGQHNIGVGYQFQKSFYAGTRDRSGPHFTVPTNNAEGNNPLPATLVGGQAFAGQDLNAQFSIRIASDSSAAVCPLCPVKFVGGNKDIGLGVGFRRVYLLTTRGEFGAAGKNGVFDTFSNYHAAYASDTWRFNKHITAIAGIRTEQERIVGNPGVTGKRVAYSFTDQWSPRLGVTVDPTGKGKSKVFYNFGRYFEFLPLDLAERSLSTEQDFYNGRYAPTFHPCATAFSATDKCADINQYGTVNPIIDNAHFLNKAVNGTGAGTTISAQDPSSPIAAGTKLGFAQEHVFGFEQQLPHDFVISFRYLDRRLKRIVEDAAVVSPEGAFTDLNEVYFIGNVNSKTDVATNPIGFKYAPGTADALKPAGCRNNPGLPFNSTTNPILYDNTGATDSNGAVVGAICYAKLGANGKEAGGSIPDGVADGFPDPVHIYKAFTIELNKRFSNNWQLLSNWNIATLRGNFEGHFRNDNGQSDPGISSLFDFTGGDFNLLGDQFAVGPLNSDRRHVVNVYGSYNFGQNGFGKSLHGLTISPAVHLESGVPISELLAHPVYSNAGEIPSGGRGKLGRTATYTRFDFHVDYPWHTSEKTSLKFVGDFFNVFNSTKIRLPDQFRQNSVAVPNVDFLTPVSFYTPFNMRLGLRFEF